VRQKGKVKSWNDEKGFGFVVPDEGGKDVFLHISAFRNRVRRPEVGQIVTYALSKDQQGRPRASKATLPGDRIHSPRKKAVATGAFTVAGAFIVSGAFLTLVVLLAIFGKIPLMVLWVYLGASLITYFFYAFDKLAAKDGAWRTSEGTLHWLSVVGGWPGALIAQQTLRHKSKKQSFRSAFWVTVVLNLGILAWVFTSSSGGLIEAWVGKGRSPIGSEHRATIEWSE
jgi:uncharacterized membrane protein YsdA (DUF1294 family)/cold shock CspA family protein